MNFCISSICLGEHTTDTKSGESDWESSAEKKQRKWTQNGREENRIKFLMAKQSDVEWEFDDICIRQRIRPLCVRPRACTANATNVWVEEEEEEGEYIKYNKERIDNKLILADHMR